MAQPADVPLILFFASVRVHSQSPNIKMFGRAIAPQSGQFGNADFARIVAHRHPSVPRLTTKWPGHIDACIEDNESSRGLPRLICGKASLLKLPIDVARENETAERSLRAPAPKNVKAGMRNSVAIQIQPMAKKSPRPVPDRFETSAASTTQQTDDHENGGYAFQNPSGPRKSGNPESTPMPAPAPIRRASAVRMASAAALTCASGVVSQSIRIIRRSEMNFYRNELSSVQLNSPFIVPRQRDVSTGSRVLERHSSEIAVH